MARPFFHINKKGIPFVSVQSVSVSGNNVKLTLPNNTFTSLQQKEVLLVNIGVEIPSGTSNSLPVVFESDSTVVTVSGIGHPVLTVEDFQHTGIYLFFYTEKLDINSILIRNFLLLSNLVSLTDLSELSEQVEQLSEQVQAL